jgi:hypothetical protein
MSAICSGRRPPHPGDEPIRARRRLRFPGFTGSEAVIPENATVIRVPERVFTPENHPRYLAVFGQRSDVLPCQESRIGERKGCFSDRSHDGDSIFSDGGTGIRAERDAECRGWGDCSEVSRVNISGKPILTRVHPMNEKLMKRNHSVPEKCSRVKKNSRPCKNNPERSGKRLHAFEFFLIFIDASLMMAFSSTPEATFSF